MVITMRIFEETAEVTESYTWESFWQKVADFFWIPDTSGLNYLTRILIAIAIIVVSFFLIRFIGWIIKKILKVNKKGKGPEIDSSAKFFFVTFIKILLWIGIAFVVIGVLKIDTSGIAGVTSAITVALGLALQDLISCFASGIIILQQKNIATGEYISVKNGYGEVDGTVDRIHFFFTYLRTPNGQEVTVSNYDMLKAVITNYTRLGKRRLHFDVGVHYDTDIALAKQILLDMVKDDPRHLADEECMVYVYELGAYSVGLRIRIWTPIDQYWNVYNELPEKILLAFREANINIPSSTDILIKK